MTESALPDMRTPAPDDQGGGGHGRHRRYLPSPQVLDELAGLDLSRVADDLRSCLSELDDSEV